MTAEVEPDCKLLFEFENATDNFNNFGFMIDSVTGTITVGSNGIYTNEKMNFDGQEIHRFLVSN